MYCRKADTENSRPFFKDCSLMPNKDAFRCRVCGFLESSQPWGAAGRSPDFFICPCCGVEHGYEDATHISGLADRQRWLFEGAKWHTAKSRPPE